MADIYRKSSEECIGFRHHQKAKDWITPDTWAKINARREIKNRMNEAKSSQLKERFQLEYSEIQRDVKKMTRTDKRSYMDSLASKAEEAANKGEQGNLYKITKIICGKSKTSSNVPIKDKQGKLLTSEKEQEIRWTEHFKEILNRPPPLQEPEIQEPDEDLDISIEPPSKSEIITAIKSLKNGKAPGCDNLNAELFKTDPTLAANILYPIFHDIWKETVIPTEWNKGTIIRIPKKGARSDCNNWRGITLLSIPSKILAKIIIKRISDAVDSLLRNEQAGFRPGRGCTDQIFALRNIIEQCSEWQRQLYINFIDFEKAFDSIHRDSLWKIVRSYGVPQHLIQLIKGFYNNFTCKVGSSDLHFQVKTGGRQGCVMSSTLFIIAIDWVMRQTTSDSNRGIRWGIHTVLEDLDFADDIAMFSHTHQHLQEKTNRLQKYAGQIGLNVNAKKTEIMTLNTNRPSPVMLGEQELSTTNTFTYLGSVVNTDGGAETDIQQRLCKARTAFKNLQAVWRSGQYTIRTKLHFYKSCILPILLYGSECWRMTECDQQKLSTFHTRSLRRILRIFWPQKVSNQDLLNRCQLEDMAMIITKRRWKWLGHVLRKDHSNITRTALFWTPEGKRKRGRPKITWRLTVEAEMKAYHQTWGTLQKKASDRQGWRDFVAALHARGHNGQ